VMYKNAMRAVRLAPAALVGALMAGCGGGTGEFVDACMKESGGMGGEMFEREMGMKKEEFCKCGAKTAKSSLSGKAFHAMVLDMQGKKQEAYEITSKMDTQEQQQLFMGMANVFQSCARVGN
ncbi:MAG: hypothetical protein ACRET4_04975, partial [Steroidobacteraceae bacterium]